MFHGDGLCLEISPEGGKWWRLKHRYGGKEKRRIKCFGFVAVAPLSGRYTCTVTSRLFEAVPTGGLHNRNTRRPVLPGITAPTESVYDKLTGQTTG